VSLPLPLMLLIVAAAVLAAAALMDLSPSRGNLV
jgi:hypothetical protein